MSLAARPLLHSSLRKLGHRDTSFHDDHTFGLAKVSNGRRQLYRYPIPVQANGTHGSEEEYAMDEQARRFSG